MSTHDWTKFTKRINIKVAAQDIYNAWITRNNIETWFLRSSEFTDKADRLRQCDDVIHTGDTYKWMWHGYPNSVVEDGEILEANGKNTIRFTFSGPPESPMVVTVKITEEEGESIVSLTQENIPLDDDGRMNFHVGRGEGWTFYLANLKSILEGGIDLRNKNEKLTKMINS